MYSQNQTSNINEFLKFSKKIDVKSEIYKEKKGILPTAENKAFLSKISHDIKNPFGALLGYSDLILEDFSELSEAEKLLHVAEIKKTANHTYKYLERFFEWMYYETNKYELSFANNSLREITSEALKKVFNGCNFTGEIEFDIDADLKIFSDFDSSVKLFFYVLENSSIYCKQNGKVLIKAFQDDDYVKIQIIDDGDGISEDKIRNIFNLTNNISSSENGTGLGLILTKQLVEINNGNIQIQSEINVGTTINIMLPKLRACNIIGELKP